MPRSKMSMVLSKTRRVRVHALPSYDQLGLSELNELILSPQRALNAALSGKVDPLADARDAASMLARGDDLENVSSMLQERFQDAVREGAFLEHDATHDGTENAPAVAGVQQSHSGSSIALSDRLIGEQRTRIEMQKLTRCVDALQSALAAGASDDAVERCKADVWQQIRAVERIAPDDPEVSLALSEVKSMLTGD